MLNIARFVVTEARPIPTAVRMSRLDHPAMPYLATLAAVGLLSLMDALMKGAALAAGAYSATLLRSGMATAIALPWWLSRRPRMPRGRVLAVHLERGAVSAFMALSFFYALTKLPLAEAIAISFVAPLVALYFARIFLGELITRRAIFASLLGLAGTLVIVWARLGRADFGQDTALGLAALAFSALLYAYNFTVIRRQAQLAGPLEIATFHAGVSAVLLGLAAPFLFALPAGAVLGQTALAAAISVAAAMALAWAYARAEAQALVPLEYSGFLWAALFGWLFFAEGVTAATMFGVAIIVAACWLAAPRARRVPTTETANL